MPLLPLYAKSFYSEDWFLKNFEKVIPPSKAIFFSGLLFALFHFHPFNIIPLTVLGIFLTFIVYHSGSIYTAVICHFLNNFISAAAVYVYGADSLDTEKISPDDQMQFILLGVFSLAVFIIVIILIKKYSVINKDSIKNDVTGLAIPTKSDLSDE